MKQFCSLVGLLCLTTFSLYAYNFQSGDFYYNITGAGTVEVVNPTYVIPDPMNPVPPVPTDPSSYEMVTADIPETVTDNGITYTVTGLGLYAFHECPNLTSVTIPRTVTRIDRYAFYRCTSLTTVIVPNSVNDIDDYSFSGCINLTSIVVEEGNTTYDSRNNCNAIIHTASNTLMFGCINTVIPNTVTVIGRAFAGVPLTSISIPDNVTTIGAAAFNDCSRLTSVTLGAGVTKIKVCAFQLCKKLTTLVSYAVLPPVCEEYVFDDIPKKQAVLYVPAESLEAYKAADTWKTFPNIQPLSNLPSAIGNINMGDGTGMGNNAAQKILRNGQVLILRNGKTYTLTGNIAE